MSTNEQNVNESNPDKTNGSAEASQESTHAADASHVDAEARAAMDQVMQASEPTKAAEEAPASEPPAASPPAPAGNVDDALNAEIESALGDMSVADMIDEDVASPHALTAKPIEPGQPLPRQARPGVIVAIHGDHLMVEFGPKMHGMCPLSAFKEAPAVGSTEEFILDKFDKNEGLYLLSRRGTVRKAEWESLEVGQTVKALCTGTNKGGLEMEVANQRAFMPSGQVDLRHVDDMEQFVGKTMDCAVIEFNRQRRRIILSRRRVLADRRMEEQKELLKDLEVGQSRTATITSVKPYGAFADIGGLDGLIHVSDLSHDRISDPSKVVSVGDTVEVKILKIEGSPDKPNDMRVGLGMKQLQDDPFAKSMSEITEGETMSGKVTKIMDFGAFIELAPGVEGLVHISELAHERVKKVEHIVKQDEVVQVKILSVDADSKRVSLSIKALKEAPKGAKGVETGTREEDPEMRKLKAMLSSKFNDNLLGGLGNIPGEESPKKKF